MDIITYTLRPGGIDSGQFYRELSVFTDEVISEIEGSTQKLVQDYIAYRNAQDKGIYSKEEYAFELLVLGVLWQVYSGDAAQLNAAPKQILSQLVKMREQGGSLKPGIDFVRGILSTAFLSPDLYDNMVALDINLENMNKLLDWLEATGEFKHETLRLRQWQAYFMTLSADLVFEALTLSLTIALWFELRSVEVLGKYTTNVERYLTELRPQHYWHEDVIFCGRRRVEYHLNMVGAEVMNRAYRESFISTTKKVVVLPACLRFHPSATCKGEFTRGSMQCKNCSPECIVNKLTILGRFHGFNVTVIPHESSISAGRQDNAFLGKNVGVLGVACVLNLISGGWMLNEMGIPAQCVILDYCGCKNHWSKEGFCTDLNIDQLKKILNIAH